MIPSKIIKQYYRTNYKTIYNQIPNPQFRIFRLKTFDKKYVQNKTKITSPQKLLQLLMSDDYAKIYISVNEWLQPHKHYGKNLTREGYRYADSIMLTSNLFIDLDGDAAIRDARKIINYLKNKRSLTLKTIQFSGGKGIHLIYQTPKITEPDPIKRIQKYKQQKNKILKKLLTLQLETIDETHQEIIKDQHRVYACPATIKAETGLQVRQLTLHEIMNHSMQQIMQRTLNIHSLVSRKAMITGKVLHYDNSKTIITSFSAPIRTSLSGKEPPRLSSYPTTYNFISNQIHGVKDLYIPLLKFDVSRYNKKRLKKTQHQYKLTTFYIFKDGRKIIALCLKATQQRRLLKIMRKAGAENTKQFLYYKHTWLRTTPKHKLQEETRPPIQHIENIEANQHNHHAHSKPHYNLLKKEVNLPNLPSLIGSTKNKIGTAYITT